MIVGGATSIVKDARQALARLRDAAGGLDRPASFMEVCGTHTVNAFRSGLHSLMPKNVRLLSGPGCPVCVTSQGDIDQLIELALRPDVTLCTYGDMLRVTGAHGSLEQARSNGADVRIVYSALDAVTLAAAEPRRQVVFAAVGFETTTPATAIAIEEADRRWLGNFTVLASHKLMIPAMTALLDGRQIDIDGFLCPGHVSVVIGAEAFRPIVEKYGLSCVVSGFEATHIAAGLARLVELAVARTPALENMYPQAVGAAGNHHAWDAIRRVFQPVDAYWRGLGTLPGSGLAIRPNFARFDARVRYELKATVNREPAGCRCGEVIAGRATPVDCKLFGVACTPARAVGPCMVSSEGTCQAWFKYNLRSLTVAARSQVNAHIANQRAATVRERDGQVACAVKGTSS